MKTSYISHIRLLELKCVSSDRACKGTSLKCRKISSKRSIEGRRTCDQQFQLGDLKEESFKIGQWPKGFFVQPAKTGTVTLEQLVAMFFPLNEIQFESLLSSVLLFKLELQRKQNNSSGKSHEFCGGRHCFSYCSWPPVQQKSRLLIGLNCILLCLSNST